MLEAEPEMGTHVYVYWGVGRCSQGSTLGEQGKQEEAEGVELRFGVR